ncbi:MAG: HlyD family secretion protein [Verrucomicrobiota bacterium]
MPETTATPTGDTQAPKDNWRKNRALWLFAGILLLTVISGFAYWEYRRTHISTDDAYVDGKIHMVSPRVQGKVISVLVDDNQPVRAGDPLLLLDPEPYAVRQAGAASAVAGGVADLTAARADLVAARSDVTAAGKDLEGARAQLAQLAAAIDAARARKTLTAAQLAQANRDAARMKELFERQVISRESFEKAQTDASVAKSQDDLAQEQLRLAEAAIPTQEALIAQRRAVVSQRESVVAQRQARIGQLEAALRQRESGLTEAKLFHQYTTVVAPADGYVTRKSVEVGQVVSPGQTVLAVAALDNVWVVANYKETDIARIRRGQQVEIEVDTFKGKTFRGKVDSIMAGTGSAFALFPPENASGNYVKVVQRVPVKIVVSKGEDPTHVLRIGLSVIPTVLIR